MMSLVPRRERPGFILVVNLWGPLFRGLSYTWNFDSSMLFTMWYIYYSCHSYSLSHVVTRFCYMWFITAVITKVVTCNFFTCKLSHVYFGFRDSNYIVCRITWHLYHICSYLRKYTYFICTKVSTFTLKVFLRDNILLWLVNHYFLYSSSKLQ